MIRSFAITEDRLLALLEAEAQLQALEGAGVDNWGGCDHANEFKEEVSIDNPGVGVMAADQCIPITPGIIAHTQEMYPQIDVKELLKAMGLKLNKEYFISILEKIDE